MMKRATFPLRSLTVLGLGLILLSLISASVIAEETLDAAAQSRLKHLLLQDCGSCHGLRLTGGLGPAITPQALEGKSREYLIATVLYGRPGTPMPPWKAILRENEVAWIVDRLLQGDFVK